MYNMSGLFVISTTLPDLTLISGFWPKFDLWWPLTGHETYEFGFSGKFRIFWCIYHLYLIIWKIISDFSPQSHLNLVIKVTSGHFWPDPKVYSESGGKMGQNTYFTFSIFWRKIFKVSHYIYGMTTNNQLFPELPVTHQNDSLSLG